MTYDNWKCRIPDDDRPDHESIAAHFERELIEATEENDRLRALIVLARVDLVAAKTLIEADQMATAYGLEQTIDKIDAALRARNV